jgi:hypothetical protein
MIASNMTSCGRNFSYGSSGDVRQDSPEVCVEP